MFCHKYFLKSKLWGFFCVSGQKTGTAGPIIMKLSTKRNDVFQNKNLENENLLAAAIHAQTGFQPIQPFNQSESRTLGKPTIGGPVLKYFLSETIHAQENGSRGTHFVKFLISNFPKSLIYSAMPCTQIPTQTHLSLPRQAQFPKHQLFVRLFDSLPA